MEHNTETAGLDVTNWPIVIAHMPAYHEARMESWIGGLDTVLARQEPFVVVLHLDAFLKDPRETAEEKRRGAIWFKKNRQTYVDLCKANIYVVADDAARDVALQEGRRQGDAIGLRLEATATEPEAVELARTLL